MFENQSIARFISVLIWVFDLFHRFPRATLTHSHTLKRLSIRITLSLRWWVKLSLQTYNVANNAQIFALSLSLSSHLCELSTLSSYQSLLSFCSYFSSPTLFIHASKMMKFESIGMLTMFVIIIITTIIIVVVDVDFIKRTGQLTSVCGRTVVECQGRCQ